MDGSYGMTKDATMTMVGLARTTDDLASFGQGNMEAVMKSYQLWGAGLQAISRTMAATAQSHLDQSMTTWKALFSATTLKEAMDLRSSLARSSFENAVEETGKLTDASMKLAEQAMAPIAERVTLAVEKLTRRVM